MKKYLLIFILSVASLVSYAQAGSPDPAFGTVGIVTTSFGPITAYRGSVAIQSDGKIVMAGTLNNGSNGIITLARYNTDGSLDNTFDGDGKLTTLVGPSCEASAVVIQADGKIVVVGNADDIATRSHFAVVRYNTDGTLDNTFDGDGIATPTFPASNDELANCVAIQSDGKIVVAGVFYTLTGQDFALARYNTNGSLDNTFDGDGLLATAIGSSDDMVYSIALQIDETTNSKK